MRAGPWSCKEGEGGGEMERGREVETFLVPCSRKVPVKTFSP